MKKLLNGIQSKLAVIAPVGAVVLNAGLACAETTPATPVLSGIVTQEMLSGVFGEIVGLLPVAMPVMIGYAAIRKGISFVKGIVYCA